MIKERAEMWSIWGWKDPRTSLFLDFWTSIESNIKFVFLYRDPILVMDSLFRRGDKRFVISPWLTAKLWMHYNRELLRYHKIHANRSFLVNIKGFNDNYGAAAQILGNRLGFPLNKPYADVYRSDEISMTPAPSTKLRLALLLIYYRKSLTDLFFKLERQAIINSLGVNVNNNKSRSRN